MLLSTKTALSAPLLSASIPRLPVPANKSRTLAPGTNGASILNSDSFTLSVVGLVVFPLTVFSLCPFADPEITLRITTPPFF